MTGAQHEAAIGFDRVAVLGPVEAAVRFTRTAREIGDQRGRRLHVVALHPDPTPKRAMLRAADSVIALRGPVRTRSPER